MSAVAALRAARLAGVTVWVDAGALALEAAGEPPASVLDLLARHKKEIIALLTAGPTHPSGCGVVPANDALITARCARCGTTPPGFTAIANPAGWVCASCDPGTPSPPPVASAVPPADPAEIERLALALMAEAERNPAVTITDREKARLYYRAEAMRRLDLYRRRARDAVSGPDIEREAIMGEESAPTLPAEAHAATVAPLLRAASPLAGVPGAVACRSCGRGIWCSPSWRGPQPPDLCAECWRAEIDLAHRRRNEAQAIENCRRADIEAFEAGLAARRRGRP